MSFLATGYLDGDELGPLTHYGLAHLGPPTLDGLTLADLGQLTWEEEQRPRLRLAGPYAVTIELADGIEPTLRQARDGVDHRLEVVIRQVEVEPAVALREVCRDRGVMQLVGMEQVDGRWQMHFECAQLPDRLCVSPS